MKDTSALYNQILEADNHWFEPRLRIETENGSYQTLLPKDLYSISTKNSCLPNDVPQIGGAVSGEIDVSLINNGMPTFKKMGTMLLDVRVTDGANYSEYIPMGTFFIDTREVSHNGDGLDVMTIHGYDAMLKFDQLYPSDSSHSYPLRDSTMVTWMASKVGVSVDSRTLAIMNRAYSFTPFGYTMREMLGYIASAYGGNFIMSDEGKLLLIQLGGVPTETFYLINEDGDAITFGGNRILV